MSESYKKFRYKLYVSTKIMLMDIDSLSGKIEKVSCKKPPASLERRQRLYTHEILCDYCHLLGRETKAHQYHAKCLHLQKEMRFRVRYTE